MARTALPISLGYYVDESLAISARECTNLFPHIPEGQTVTSGALIGTSGLEQLTESATNAFGRGGVEMGGKAYFVCGQKLWRIDFTEDITGVRTYTAVDVSGSELIEGEDQVFMAENGEQISIVAPDFNDQYNMWIYTVADGLKQVADADFDGPASGVTYQFGYFIYPKQDSNDFFISDLRDGSSFLATDFAAAESDPDPTVVIAPLNGLLYVFGTRTMEPYQNVGGQGFPYQAIPSAVQQKGCFAPKSMTEADGVLYWIGAGENERPSIYASDGGKPQRISTPSIDNFIYSGGVIQLAKAYVIRWSERGHSFVAWTVPLVGTMVYDLTTGAWHKRESISPLGAVTPWRPVALVDAYSVLLVNDSTTGIIGRLSENVYYEYGEEIRRYFTTPSVDNGGNPFSVNQIQLVAETGTAEIFVTPPIVRLSISKDGGRTYSPEIHRNMGLIGEFMKVISWPVLGRYSRSFTARIDISEPIKIAFVKLEVDISA